MENKTDQGASDIPEKALDKKKKEKEYDFKFDIVDFEWWCMLKEDTGS